MSLDFFVEAMMRRYLSILSAVVLVGCRDAVEPKQPPASAAVTMAAPYEIVELGTLGGASSEAVAINEQGQIVGSSQTSGGETHAFLWENGAMRDLGTLGGSSSEAVAINARGEIAGVSTDSTGADRVVLWAAGSVQDLGPVWGGTSTVRLSDGGHVAWSAPTATGAGAQLWDGSQVIDLGTLGGAFTFSRGVNARGQVVGSSRTASGATHAFLWENGVMRDLGTLGGTSSEAHDISERGLVTGSARDATGALRAFLWDGQMTDLGVLPGDAISTSAGVNELDQVAGMSYRNVDGVVKHAFIWQFGVMQPLRVPDALLFSDDRVSTVNDRGQVIGVNVRLNRIDDPWLWEAGVLWDLPTLGGTQNAVRAINNAGDIVGRSSDAAETRRAVLWHRLVH